MWWMWCAVYMGCVRTSDRNARRKQSARATALNSPHTCGDRTPTPLDTLHTAQPEPNTKRAHAKTAGQVERALGPRWHQRARSKVDRTKANKQQAEQKTKQANPAREEGSRKKGSPNTHPGRATAAGRAERRPSGRWDCVVALHATKRKGARTGKAEAWLLGSRGACEAGQCRPWHSAGKWDGCGPAARWAHSCERDFEMYSRVARRTEVAPPMLPAYVLRPWSPVPSQLCMWLC